MNLRKLLLLGILGLISFGLYAQTGLYNLRFGQALAEADSILQAQYFVPSAVENESRFTYYSEINTKVEFITLIVEPTEEIVAGWMIGFNPVNTEEEDNQVLERLVEAHTDWFRSYEDTGQLVWLLNEGRTAHLYYLGDKGLHVSYYDAAYEYLYPSKETQSGQ